MTYIRWLYCLHIVGCNLVANGVLHLTLYHAMGLRLSYHSYTFDDITLTSSGFRGNPTFFDNSLFVDICNHPSNSNFANSISIILSKNLHYILRITVFVFKLQAGFFFYQRKWIFIQNVYKERPLFDKSNHGLIFWFQLAKSNYYLCEYIFPELRISWSQ